MSAVGLFASPARADTCGPVPGFEAVFPVPGSTEVPPNGLVRVRYPLGGVRTDPLEVTVDGEPVEGVTCPIDSSCPFPGDPATGNRELSFEPAISYLPSNATVEAVGIDTDGRPFRWTFETGDERDVSAPDLQPVEDIEWAWLGSGPDDDPCGPEGLVRYQVSLWLPPAPDDLVDRENVEYKVFRTNGPGVSEGQSVLEGAAVDDGSGDLVEARIYLPNEPQYARKLCFSVAANDLRPLEGFAGSAEKRCVTLEEGPFFQSICSATPGRAAPGLAAALPLFAALTLVRRRS